MVTWDDAAPWYLRMVRDPERGFNQLASDTAVALLGGCRGADVLDLGAGEGHVARRLAAAGARVVAVEPVEALLGAAVAEETAAPLGITYRRDRAEELATVAGSSLDAVVAVLVLHHVDDLARALAQVRRVLRPGGRLVAVLPHPWSDHPEAGWVATAAGVRRALGRYGEEGRWREGGTVPVDELRSVRQIGWHHRTLGTWLTAVAAAGFVLEEVAEPEGDRSGRRDGGGPWAGVPRFLAFAAAAAAAPGGPST